MMSPAIHFHPFGIRNNRGSMSAYDINRRYCVDLQITPVYDRTDYNTNNVRLNSSEDIMAKQSGRKTPSGSSVAGFYDWTPGLKVLPLNHGGGEASKSDAEMLRRTVIKNARAFTQHQKQTGRMFAKVKSNTTKGEMAIIEGIHKNRCDGKSNINIKPLIGSDVISHHEAWEFDYNQYNNAAPSGRNYTCKGNPNCDCNDLVVHTGSAWTRTQRKACSMTVDNNKPTKNNFYMTRSRKGFRVPPLKPGNGSAYVEKIQKRSAYDKGVVWQKTVMDIYLPNTEIPNNSASTFHGNKVENLPDLVLSPSSTHVSSYIDDEEDIELHVPCPTPMSTASESFLGISSNNRPCSPTPQGTNAPQENVPVSPWVQTSSEDNMLELNNESRLPKTCKNYESVSVPNTSREMKEVSSKSILSLQTLHIS